MTSAVPADVAVLIESLESLVVRPAADEADRFSRLQSIYLLRDALGAYGIEADSFVRYGLWPQVVGTVLTAVILASAGQSSAGDPIDGVAWCRALRMPNAADTPTFKEFRDNIDRITVGVAAWARSASFESVVSYTAPTSQEIADYAVLAELDPAVGDGYRWLWERFREPDLSNWAPASLHFEFRWREGEGSAFSDEVLLVSQPDPMQLDHEIARRAVFGGREQGDFDAMLWQMQAQAQSLLQENRHAEAAALFDFYLRVFPDNTMARNNLGFCRIPTDPSSALHHLEAASKDGYASRAINTYNRCCCLWTLSREGEALDLAESYWQRDKEAENTSALLWKQGEVGWELYSEPSPNLALARLAQAVASDLGRFDREAKWAERVAAMTDEWGDADTSGQDDKADA